MNNEARKSLLKALREHLDSGMSEYCGYELSSLEAITVIDLLRFSIPIKPKMYVGEESHEPWPICPVCEKGLLAHIEKHCSECGQKIDWSEQ